jgi:hypothetical protein
MENNEQDNYTLLYIQRQEQLFVEQIKKTIDAEIRLSFAFKKYEDSQKQVELQNDMMQQAAKSIETLTVAKNNYEARIKQLEENEQHIRKNSQENEQNIRKNIETNYVDINRYKNIAQEYERQKIELQQLFDENKELKAQIESKKVINKKKVPSTITVDSEEF